MQQSDEVGEFPREATGEPASWDGDERNSY